MQLGHDIISYAQPHSRLSEVGYNGRRLALMDYFH